MNVKNLAIGGPSLVIQLCKTKHLPWALPIVLILTSFCWWESYVTHSGEFSWFWKIKMKMNYAQCVFFDFRFTPFWGKEKLSSIIASFLAGNGSYDGSINYYQKKKCGKVWESMFSHICLLSLRA